MNQIRKMGSKEDKYTSGRVPLKENDDIQMLLQRVENPGLERKI